MNTALCRVIERTVVAMIGANPKHYLSTQLRFIQGNLSRWEGIHVSHRTISRCLQELSQTGILDYRPVSIRGERGTWRGRRLLIKATGKLYQYAKQVCRTTLKFLRVTERTKVSSEPIPLYEVLRDRKISTGREEDNPKPFWSDPASYAGYLQFREALRSL